MGIFDFLKRRGGSSAAKSGPAAIDTADIDGRLLNDGHRQNRQTSLHIAAASNQLDVSRELLRRGVDTNAQNIWGATPLHLAVSNDNYEMAVLLLDHGAKVRVANNKGETPLDLANALGRLRLVSLLQ
jgi:ankyrin repeat protein